MLIVLEGIDGSGKATQAKILRDYYLAENKSVSTLDFPRYYDNFFGKFLAECLRGEHGDFLNLDPKIASILYAADRFESAGEIKSWLEQGQMVILDRYATSNLIHQGGKIKDEEKRKEFISWLYELEFSIFKIPKPDLVIYLDVSTEISLQNLKNKNEKYSAGKKDLHEENQSFLSDSRQTAWWLVEKLPDWKIIDCLTEDGRMKDRMIINQEIKNLITKYGVKN